MKKKLFRRSSLNAIAKRIVVTNDRTMLVEHGGHLTRSEREMVRRMATTSKILIAPELLKEG